MYIMCVDCVIGLYKIVCELYDIFRGTNNIQCQIMQRQNYKTSLNCIHSNKRPGHLCKSFQVGAYLFQYLLQYLLQGSTQKLMILIIFRLIYIHIELGMLVS